MSEIHDTSGGSGAGRRGHGHTSDSSNEPRARQIGARLAELTARELGLSEERVARLRVAALVAGLETESWPRGHHSTTDPELDRMASGRSDLDRALTTQTELDDVRAWIRARHERPDGHGQPEGLTREEIPVEARILSVVETYVAITTDRPHSPAMHQALALRELLDRAGTQFDAQVVAAFVRARPRQAGRGRG